MPSSKTVVPAMSHTKSLASGWIWAVSMHSFRDRAVAFSHPRPSCPMALIDRTAVVLLAAVERRAVRVIMEAVEDIMILVQRGWLGIWAWENNLVDGFPSER